MIHHLSEFAMMAVWGVAQQVGLADDWNQIAARYADV